MKALRMSNSWREMPVFPGNIDDLAGREFISLYTRHARQLYRFIRAFIPNQADSEDTFQEVSIVLWKKFSQFQRGTSFAAWATQVARYAILDLRTYNRRVGGHLTDEFLNTVTEEAVQMYDLLEAQHRALADCYKRLSASDRHLIDRRYRAGMTVKDISEQLGRPLRTVYRLLDRIHRTLLDCIERNLKGEGSNE